MAETVYITSENQAIFRCPECQRTKTVDAAAFDQLKPPLRFRMKCPCGHETTAIVEKRRRFRKETALPGRYVHYVNGHPRGKGVMTVKDISTSGMKLEVAASGTMAEGDLLKVEFRLDNPACSLLTKKLVIRNIVGNLIGTQFAPTEILDKALGFYLRS